MSLIILNLNLVLTHFYTPLTMQNRNQKGIMNIEQGISNDDLPRRMKF
ncbi:MAG: hypothetical protein Q8N83_02810 [Ignavibacteria bacterium]|nr:hypothetical protein [Ignavibacteria bacterium]